MLHAVDCNLGLQTTEALVRLDLLERFLNRGFGGVRGEGFEDCIGRGLADRGNYGLQRLRATRKERNSEIAVRRRRQNARNTRALEVLAIQSKPVSMHDELYSAPRQSKSQVLWVPLLLCSQ